jgi:hypothetical protein
MLLVLLTLQMVYNSLIVDIYSEWIKYGRAETDKLFDKARRGIEYYSRK